MNTKRDPARVLVAGHAGADRPRVLLTLQRAGLEIDERAEPARLAGVARPRLVVLDDAVPAEKQAATQQRLREHPALRGVPLVVLSHSGGIDSFGSAFARGASAHLGRPLDEAVLWDVVTRLLAWRGPTLPSARQTPRRALVLEVAVEVPQRGWQRGQILEVSASGCRLTLRGQVAPGMRLGIVPVWQQQSTEIRLGGSVRWCRREPVGSFLAGVRWSATGGVVVRRLFGLPS